MLLVSLISYIDRNTLALLAPTILREMQISNQQYGWIVSSFSVLYMLGNPVWGSLLDRMGVRRGMLLAVSFWSVASAAHALVQGAWGFALVRALLGFGEGATFPGGLRTIMQTLPPSQRSRGVAVAYSGGSLGAIVTPLLVTPIAVAYGWRAAFLLTGVVGLAWVLLWLGVSRTSSLVEEKAISVDPVSSRSLLADRRLWAYACAYGLGALPLSLVLYGAPLYLSSQLGFSQAELGKVLWIPPLGWEAGYFAWGWVADRARWPLHRCFAVLSLLSLPIAATPYTQSAALVLGLFFFAMFTASGFIVLSLRYATDALGRTHAGFLAGMGAGAWSALVAGVMPVIGRLFDGKQYAAAFLLVSLVPLLGWLGWRFLSANSRQPLSVTAGLASKGAAG